MTTFDFSPLYRTTVGFDRLASLLASARKVEQGNSYPPYNIKSTEENHYQISMAVAGFAEDELDISYEQNILTVSGNRDAEEENDGEYLYQGIAKRSFERKFNLADHVRVTGAGLENGLLHIFLERELPEAMKPRKIKIAGSSARLIETEANSKAA